mgnify:CR=1 FL=1
MYLCVRPNCKPLCTLTHTYTRTTYRHKNKLMIAYIHTYIHNYTQAHTHKHTNCKHTRARTAHYIQKYIHGFIHICICAKKIVSVKPKKKQKVYLCVRSNCDRTLCAQASVIPLSTLMQTTLHTHANRSAHSHSTHICIYAPKKLYL